MEPTRGNDAALGAGGIGRKDLLRDPLPPIVSAALDRGGGGGSLYARLKESASHSRTDGRYKILGEIAHGGMGRILRVWDEDLQRELAMKEMSSPRRDGDSEEEHLRREQMVARFIEEARITGQLDHPGIVPVHDIAVDREGAVYFTMPLVRGYDLTRVFLLLREGKEAWTLHRALNVLLKVTLAVAFAHSKGVIHRDLKPANVMVGTFGETYVVDWGLAIILGRKARAGIVGTPAYMSPEQAGVIEAEVGPRADVYSLGAILYELCARRMPHESSLLEGVQSSDELLVEPPRPLHEIDPNLPPELVAVCEKAMAWEPRDRYASALGLAEDLRAWLEGRVVAAYDSSTWAHVKKWRQRNRGLSAALETICALVILSIGAVIWQQQNKLTAVATEHEHTVRENYSANLRGAELGLRLHDALSAKRSLNACAEQHRGWEWQHLYFCSDLSVTRFEGHTETIRSVAIHPSGHRMATASDDGTVRIWDLETGTEIARLLGHEGPVTDVCFDATGNLLASGSADHTTRLWEVSSASAQAVLEGDDTVGSIAFSPDGTALAVGDHGGTLRIWDVATRTARMTIELPTGTEAQNLGVVWSPDGTRLFNADVFSLTAWDTDTGRMLADLGKQGSYALAIDPNGSLLAATVATGEILILDAVTLEVVRTLSGHEGLVYGVAFDSSGERLFSGSSDRTAAVWDVETGAMLERFVGHTKTVTAVIPLPSGGSFVSASGDKTARLWQVATLASVVVQAPGRLPDPVGLSADGKWLASASGKTLHLVDTATGETVETIAMDAPSVCIAFSGDGTTIACATIDRTITVWSLAERRHLNRLPAGANVRNMAFSPDGTRLLSRGEDQILRLTEIATGTVVLTIDYSGGAPLVERKIPPKGLAFAPDGESFAAGMLDGRIEIINAASGELIQRLTGHTSWVNSLSYGPDGRVLISGSADATAALWDLRSGQRITSFNESKGVAAAIFLDDGRRVVTSSFANQVRVWETRSGKLLLSLPLEDRHVVAIGFDAVEGRLVAASTEHRVRSWLTRPLPAR